MDKNLIEKIFLFGLIFLIPFFGFSQAINLLIQQGDTYAENNDYLSAIKYYKGALEQDPNHTAAQYKIAESYRSLLDYKLAEEYYQKVKRKNDGRFLLAGYYFALMKKLNGDFQIALEEFENFMALLKERKQHEDPQYRPYYDQARIEREGCLLALNEMTVAQPEHEFTLLPEPVNGKTMDSAPATYTNDSTITISSGRKGGEGSGIGAFGEAWNDIYMFEKKGSGWSEVKNNQDLDVVNSKTEDAAGFFNYSRTKFYFTRCEVASATSINCFIYVSSLKGNSWSEPRKLNAYINETGSNSRQSTVTYSGDSLFFCSDRAGGFGRYDIYLSIKNGDENWGPAMNLGSQINTPFTESSPFYEYKEGNLFFSSDGHRGFGGFDVYLAKGTTFEKAEIYNVGAPYNSNKDDLFYFLGDHYGYVCSNRDGGVGKMDIYSFRIKSDQEIITEITSDESIAGRNSLFSDDYDFDSDNDEKVSEIISHLMAAGVAQVDMALTSEQLVFYNSLSKDDRERIDRIVNARVRNLSQNDLQAIRVEDEFYYASMESEDKRHIDNLVSAYVRENGLGLSVSIKKQEQDFYESLSVADREKVDMIIAERLKKADEYSYPALKYGSLTLKDQQSVDVLSYKLIEEKKNLQNLALAFNENLFLKNNESRKPLIHESIKEKVINLTEDPKYKLKEEDRIFYQNLDSEQLGALNDIATALVMNDVNGLENGISQQDKNVYASFTSSQRKQLDRILVKIINNTVKADLYMGEANFTKNQVAVAKLNPDIDVAFNQLKNVNPEFLAALPQNEHILVKRFINVADPWVNSPSPIYLPRESVEKPTTIVDRGPSIASIRNAKNNPTIIQGGSAISNRSTINNADIGFYENLSPEKRGAINRTIASILLTESYAIDPALSGSDVEAFDNLNTKEKGYIQILSRELAGRSLTATEKIEQAVATSYFDHLPANEKKTFGRLIIKEALSPYRTGNNYGTSNADKNTISSLTTFEQSNMEKLKAFAAQNSLIIENTIQAATRQNQNVLVSIPSDIVEQYNQLNITGKLLNSANQTAASATPIKLITNNGIAIQETVSTTNGSFTFSNVPNSPYTIELTSPETGNQKLIYVDELVVRGAGSLASGINAPNQITPEDKVYYSNLSKEKQKAFDRAIAAELINEAYKSSPNLLLSDEQFYNTLSEKEKKYISILAKDLKGEAFSTGELSVRATAFSYYKHLIPAEQPIWSRLITQEALAGYKAGNLYTTSGQDQQTIASLSYSEKNTYDRILQARRINTPLMADQSGLSADRDVLVWLPEHSYNSNINVGGQVNKTKTEIPVADVALNMVNADNVAISQASTDENGRFQFTDVTPGNHSVNTDANTQNGGNLYVSDLTISDNNGSPIINPGISGSTSLAQSDINFYRGLNVRDQKIIDRSIAAEITNSTYQKSPGLAVSDDQLYSSLSSKEKEYIHALAKELSGATMSPQEQRSMQAATSYYQHIPPQEQSTWSRLITNSALSEFKKGNTLALSTQDNQFIKGLSSNEKLIYNRIKEARLSTGIFASSSMTTTMDRAVLLQLPEINYGTNTQIQVSGRVNEIKSDQPLTNISLKMTDLNGTVISRTASNSNGRFTFDKITAGPYQIQVDLPTSPSVSNINMYVDEISVISLNPTNQLASNVRENTVTLRGEDITLYQDLERAEKRRIDRLIAADYLNNAYKKNPSLESSDEKEYNTLSSQEKTYIKILTKDLLGEELNPGEHALLSEAFAYYYNVAAAQKAVFNRIVAKQVFNGNRQGNNFRLSSTDANYRLRLSNEMKGMLQRLETFRFNNERILSENLAVEAIDIGDRKVVLNIPKYNNEEFSRLTITGKLINTKTGNPISTKALRVVDENGVMIAKTFTGNDGGFHFNEIRAGNYHLELEHAYSARNENETYFVKDLEVSGTQGMTYAYQKSFNIYFESADAHLRKEAMVALKEVAELNMRQAIVLELRSHTDNIGNADYNKRLSSLRGESAIEFLTKNGVNPVNISVLAYGQIDPAVPNTDEYGRQFNRRVEVIIKSHDPINYQPPTVYLIRPKATLYSISKNFHLTVDEVMKLNGLTQPGIQAYKPIRIHNPTGLRPNLDMLVELNESVTTTNSFKYTVKAGESIISIAEKFNLPEELLMEMNGLTTQEVSRGQVLNIYVRY